MFRNVVIICGVGLIALSFLFFWNQQSGMVLPDELISENTVIEPDSSEEITSLSTSSNITPSATALDNVPEVQPMVNIREVQIPVTIADTVESQRQGLSGTASLETGTGKLFVFTKSDTHGFWMKDMNYAIDIIWIDASGTIVYIVPSLAPDSYPSVYASPVPAKYVLEVNAGFTRQQGIVEGDQVDLPAGI